MHIVICLDYSEYAEKVVRTAYDLVGARQPELQLSVIHVLDEELMFGALNIREQILAELKEESNQIKAIVQKYFGPDIHYIEEQGRPQTVIQQLLGELEYDLLVMGSHGRNMFERMVMGSTATYILQQATKPTLLVP